MTTEEIMMRDIRDRAGRFERGTYSMADTKHWQYPHIVATEIRFLLSELDRWENIAERIEQLQLDPIHRPDGFTVLTAVRGLIRRSSQQPAAGSPEGSDE